jgi:hypothetical protein
MTTKEETKVNDLQERERERERRGGEPAGARRRRKLSYEAEVKVGEYEPGESVTWRRGGMTLEEAQEYVASKLEEAKYAGSALISTSIWRDDAAIFDAEEEWKELDREEEEKGGIEGEGKGGREGGESP